MCPLDVEIFSLLRKQTFYLSKSKQSYSKVLLFFYLPYQVSHWLRSLPQRCFLLVTLSAIKCLRQNKASGCRATEWSKNQVQQRKEWKLLFFLLLLQYYHFIDRFSYLWLETEKSLSLLLSTKSSKPPEASAGCSSTSPEVLHSISNGV